jgi:uncharacterized membrane protein
MPRQARRCPGRWQARARGALAQGDREMAARQLTLIRWIVATDLVLGLITVAIGASGRYWG